MMITIGKHVADFKQAWFRRSMHISFIKDPRPCGCRWLASKSLFPVVGISAPASGIKEISDLPPTQHHYTDHSEESTPFGNQTIENPWKIHGTSENPWKIHGNVSRVSEFPKLFFFLDGNNFQLSAAAWRSPLRRPWSLKTRTRYFFMSSLILAKQSVTWILCHQKYQKCHANI